MTEEEGDLLYGLKEKFWDEFKWLVRRTLDEAPTHLEHELKPMIQDMTSVFHPGIPERGERRPQRSPRRG